MSVRTHDLGQDSEPLTLSSQHIILSEEEDDEDETKQ